MIDELCGDLTPVTPRRPRRGMTLCLLAAAGGAAVLLTALGLRPELSDGKLPPLALLQLFWSAGLAIIAQVCAVRMAMPAVGSDNGGWRWAALVALAMPLAALASLVAEPAAAWEASHPHAGVTCLWQGFVGGLAVAAALTLWLRQGAPVSPERAGLVTGIASGATGAAIVVLHCPVDALMHVGIWHSAIILGGAAGGRLLLPSLLRW
jgi:hypothetical protein